MRHLFNPRYFSGTGCEATATPVPLSGYLTHAQLLVGDTVVKEYWDTSDPGCPNPVPTDGSVITGTSTQPVPQLAALFDSTHFMDSTMITLKLRVWDSNGGYYDGTIQARAYNKLLALGNQTFGADAQNCVPEVESVSEGVNYDVDHSFHDDVAAILKELPKYTAFYLDSHGGDATIDDCLAAGEDDPTHLIGAKDVENALGAKVLNNPPYNFTMFDACKVMGDKYDDSTTSDDAAMSSGFGLPTFGPHGNLNFGAGTDRAALGWDWPTLENDANVQWTKRLWDYLVQGVPLRQAAALASVDGDAQGESHLPNTFIFQYCYTSINPVIQGDSNMTLHGVYGGNHSEDNPAAFAAQWYRPI